MRVLYTKWTAFTCQVQGFPDTGHPGDAGDNGIRTIELMCRWTTLPRGMTFERWVNGYLPTNDPYRSKYGIFVSNILATPNGAIQICWCWIPENAYKVMDVVQYNLNIPRQPTIKYD